MDILKKVLARVTPQHKDASPFIKELEKRMQNIKVKLLVGGSYAKQTYLKDDFDVDVFVRFHYQTYKDQDISQILYSFIEDFEPVIVQGSRTYYQIEKDGFLYELVPVLHITEAEKAENTMDMSPLHVHWVRQHMIDNPTLADNIRLAKAFCKAQKVYGAESYIQGISGHVLDILIVHYGTFLQLLDAVKDWEENVIIDTEQYYTSKDDLRNAINKAKLVSPLVVIDPILPSRNAAAALSQEQYERFKEAARAFLDKPSETFFEKQPIDVREGTIIDVVSLDKREDIAGSKVVKALHYILFKMKKYGFDVTHYDWEWDKKNARFLICAENISAKYKRQGPFVQQVEHVQQFKDLYSDTFEKDRRVWARTKREYTSPTRFIEQVVFPDPYFSSLVEEAHIHGNNS